MESKGEKELLYSGTCYEMREMMEEENMSLGDGVRSIIRAGFSGMREVFTQILIHWENVLLQVAISLL